VIQDEPRTDLKGPRDGSGRAGAAINSSGIFIREVRVRHFRCLRSVDVELDYLTLIIGQNNAGKTSFLNALFAAIGSGQRTISTDDIFLLAAEASPDKSRYVAIDILIRPTDEQGRLTDSFPAGSPWLAIKGCKCRPNNPHLCRLKIPQVS
jgi:putative ATP-dependent endonuclease of the OLD family